MKLAKSLLIASALSGLIATTSFADDALVAKGEKIFKTKKLGNCVACHAVNGKQNIQDMGPGSFGPKLSGMKYYPDEYLYGAIYDIYAAKGIQISAMPAFGKSGMLNDAEIKALVAYLKTVD